MEITCCLMYIRQDPRERLILFIGQNSRASWFFLTKREYGGIHKNKMIALVRVN